MTVRLTLHFQQEREREKGRERREGGKLKERETGVKVGRSKRRSVETNKRQVWLRPFGRDSIYNILRFARAMNW